ncbi:MAG: family 10 glycosylhydrolase [Ferruginibacter sp.]
MKQFVDFRIPGYPLLSGYCLLLFLITGLPVKLRSQAAPEFRGVWIATVDNIDWPGKGNFNSDSQKTAFIRLLDMHQRNGINALIVQVRPCADAFYPSQYEPWSEWLTGRQGQAPAPFYDPLAFMIAETHRRGMVFHAWMNPYRAIFNMGNPVVSATHITRLHPEWFVTYGNQRFFDPGNKEAQEYVTRVVADVVDRYDVDAIHFDDYFYPYHLKGKEFPDYASYRRYGNGMKKDDWRRSNTDSIIAMLSRAIKKENKKCQFGISPFGVWRNQEKDPVNGSRTNGAQSNYDDLYADILLWLKNGWIDYVAPQLYWEIGHPVAPYEVLLDWWSKHLFGRHCYIGMGIYKAKSNAAWRSAKQLPRQITAMRNTPNMKGMIFYSSKTFERNPHGWSDSLRLNYFRDAAGIPEMEWLK